MLKDLFLLVHNAIYQIKHLMLCLCVSLSFSLSLSPFRSSFGNNTVLLPRESESGLGRVSDYYSEGTSGGEPLVERSEPRSRGVVRFAPDVKY